MQESTIRRISQFLWMNIFYKTVIQNITECLRGIELDEKYLNSLLSVLEANLSYIPSSTSKKELTDISLYDHIK